MGNEVPVQPLSSLAGPRQVRAATDAQLLQSSEAFYALRQGFDSWTVTDIQCLQAGETFYALRQGFDS